MLTLKGLALDARGALVCRARMGSHECRTGSCSPQVPSSFMCEKPLWSSVQSDVLAECFRTFLRASFAAPAIWVDARCCGIIPRELIVYGQTCGGHDVQTFLMGKVALQQSHSAAREIGWTQLCIHRQGCHVPRSRYSWSGRADAPPPSPNPGTSTKN